MNLSTEAQTQLKKIAKRNKMTYTEVVKMYEEAVKGTKDKIKEIFIIRKIQNEIRREKQKQQPFKRKAQAQPVYGFIAGDMGLRDTAEEMRRNIKRFIEKNSVQEAIEAQYINGDNRILDQREMIYGKPNPNHLEVLDKKDDKGNIRKLILRKRTLFGFFRKNGERTFKPTMFQTNDNKIAKAWNKIKFFTPCQTFGIIKEDNPEDMRLNSSQAENTMSVFKALKEDWDINTIITQSLKSQETKIQNVEKHFKTYKDAWDRRIFLRGIVTWINVDRPGFFGNIWMQLMDPEDEEAVVRVSIPQHLIPNIDFGPLSEIRVFGQTKRSKYRDNETQKLVDGDVIVNAFGLYPIPGLSTPKESAIPESLEDEEEIEGWLS